MERSDPLSYMAYRTAASVASPLLAAWLRITPRHRALRDRFCPVVPQLESAPVWVHACSVGELGAAKPLVNAIHDRWPDVPVVLTVSTDTGLELARTMAGPWLHIARLPFDTPRAIRRFLDALAPRGLLLMETELWPSLIYETRRNGVPVLLVSGRISAKHYGRYRKASWLFRPLLERLTAAAVQTPLYAERLEALGVPRNRIHVTGNAKYDGAITDPDGIDDIAARLGLGPDSPNLVFGSTRPGDEALAVACWQRLRARFPTLRLIVAPRHLQRLDEALSAIGQPTTRWSAVTHDCPCDTPVLVVDTMGELIRFYALATIAVVGGSFYPGVEGHNPFEPAALGVPTVFGPFMANFAEPAAMLLDAGGAVQVSGPDALEQSLADLLADPARRQVLGDNARAAVAQSRGAIRRTLDLVQTHLVL